MKIKSIKQVKNLKEKKVLLRVDFNILSRKNKVIDNYKIIATLPTIKYLLKEGARVIILTHFKRPVVGKKGLIQGRAKYSVQFIAKHFAKIMGKRYRIVFVDDLIGSKAKEAVANQKKNEIVFLQNVRFARGEYKNRSKFAKSLSKLANIYVNDAFSVCHRKQASLVAIKKYLPSYAGLLLESELNNLDKVLHPRKPLVVIMGGAKINTKLPLLSYFSKIASKVLVGGVIANNFLASQKFEIGKSISDPKNIKLAKKIFNEKIVYPSDVVIKRGTHIEAKRIEDIKKEDMILDIGPRTMRLYSKYIKRANTIIWNGPLGMFEEQPFKHGSLFVGRAIASRSKGQAFGLVGGGETIEILQQTKMFDYIDWVSTGGGAILTYLSKGKMPGLEKIVKL
ncbi:MAG: phosphoglycerate kinase [bacterium]